MKSWTAVVITAIVAGVALGWGGHAAWNAIETAGTPTSSWPLRVEGTASPAQPGRLRLCPADHRLRRPRPGEDGHHQHGRDGRGFGLAHRRLGFLSGASR